MLEDEPTIVEATVSPGIVEIDGREFRTELATFNNDRHNHLAVVTASLPTPTCVQPGTHERNRPTPEGVGRFA